MPSSPCSLPAPTRGPRCRGVPRGPAGPEAEDLPALGGDVQRPVDRAGHDVDRPLQGGQRLQDHADRGEIGTGVLCRRRARGGWRRRVSAPRRPSCSATPLWRGRAADRPTPWRRLRWSTVPDRHAVPSEPQAATSSAAATSSEPATSGPRDRHHGPFHDAVTNRVRAPRRSVIGSRRRTCGGHVEDPPATPALSKFVRYSGVSVVAVVTTQLTLFVCQHRLGWPPVSSNITATAVGAVPAYLLNRRWVWASPDRTRCAGRSSRSGRTRSSACSSPRRSSPSLRPSGAPPWR